MKLIVSWMFFCVYMSVYIPIVCVVFPLKYGQQYITDQTDSLPEHMFRAFAYNKKHEEVVSIRENLKGEPEKRDIKDCTLMSQIFSRRDQGGKEGCPDVCKKILAINSRMVNTELTLCAMIWLNFSSKDIARYTFVQPKTVQIKKYRLSKKLQIPDGEDIYQWIKRL